MLYKVYFTKIQMALIRSQKELQNVKYNNKPFNNHTANGI